MSEVEWHRTSGGPDPEQERVLLAALEKLLVDEKAGLAASRWKLEGRSDSLGLGASENRRTFGAKAWMRGGTVSWSGGAPSIRVGRGDAK